MKRQFALIRTLYFHFGMALLFTFVVYPAFSQQKKDTLLQAVELNKTAQYKQEYLLLSVYRKQHPNNVDAEWLFGQSAFYLGKTKEMMQVYETNIKANNENYYLKLDYAFKLVEAGQIDKAKQLLQLYLPYDSANAQIYASLAKIDYWQSNYKTAYRCILKAILLDPINEAFKKQRSEILLAMSPWVGAMVEYNKDNQPLKTISPTIEGAMYFNALAMVHASIQSMVFDTNNHFITAQLFQVDNKAVFAKQGIIFRLQAGAIYYPNKTTKALGLIGIDKTFFKGLTITTQAERKPYVNMLSSLDTAIATTNLTASVKWDRPKSFMGQASYSAAIFDDKNIVSTKSAWLVSPELNVWKFGFRAGYGYSYTTSIKEMFVAAQNPTLIVTDTVKTANIPGKFSPYLTPKDQQVNSAIAIINYNPNSFIKLLLSGSYGFYATTKTPYIIGYHNALSKVETATFNYPVKYSTLDITARADVNITRFLSVKAEYHHNRPNFYYTNDYAALGLKMILCHGK